MKTFGKVIGALLLILLLLVVGAGFALTQFFDPNDYKDDIRQLAHKHANIELELNGEIGWSLFPWLGLEITDAKIASADTPEVPLATLRLLGLSVKVLPLLRKEIQMSDIRVDGLALNLQRDAKGQSNWDNIGQSNDQSASTSNPTTPEPAKDEHTDVSSPTVEVANTPLQLAIDSLIVNGASVVYNDQQSGQQFNLESVQLTTGAIRENQPVAVKFSGFLANAQPALRGRIELATTLNIQPNLETFLLDDLRLAGEISGEPLQNKSANISARGNLAYNTAQQSARWDNLKLSVNQLKALGELQATQLDTTANISGALSIAPVNLQEFLTGIGVELPLMANKKALSHMELNARVQGTANSLILQDMQLQLDQTAFTGSVGMKDFASGLIYAHLSGDTFNADHYLAPSSTTAATERKAEVKQQSAQTASGSSQLPNAPSKSPWNTEKILPIASLKAINADLDFSFDQLTLNALDIAQAKFKLQAKQGVLQLKHLQGQLFNGEFQVAAQLNANTAQPTLNLTHTSKNIPIEKILTALDEEVTITGLLNTSSTLRTQGNTGMDWVKNLQGNLTFALNNGVLPGADLERQLCMGIATLNRKQLSPSTGSKDTPFNQLSGQLNIHKGVAHNPDLRVAIPGLAVKGKGDIDLNVLGLDYYAGILVQGNTQPMADPACKVNKNFINIEWPVRCRGPLELGAKACRIDQNALGKIAADLAKDKLSEKLNEKISDKLDKKLDNKVSPELKDALKGLFGR